MHCTNKSYCKKAKENHINSEIYLRLNDNVFQEMSILSFLAIDLFQQKEKIYKYNRTV